MKFHALAVDYDGTIAREGSVPDSFYTKLKTLKESGRKVILNTGRELKDLLTILKKPEAFDLIIAENGGLIYNPDDRSVKFLADPPKEDFIKALKDAGVQNLSMGEIILATWRPQEDKVIKVIGEMSLDYQVIFNIEAVMILPAGVNKASGLKAALSELELSPHNVVGAGDAENDYVFLKECGCSVAVNNALQPLKEQTDFVAGKDQYEGISQVIDLLLGDESVLVEASEKRHRLPIGETKDKAKVNFSATGGNVLIAGSSGGGKSTLATTIIEQLIENQYQFCLVDPEGDFGEFSDTTALGDSKNPPNPEEVSKILRNPRQNLILNLVGVPLVDRPQEFFKIFSRLQDLRSSKGRPHWLIIDEAHHVLPRHSDQAEMVLPETPYRTIMVTMNPADLYPDLLKGLQLFIGVGKEANAVLRELAISLGREVPRLIEEDFGQGWVVVWELSKEKDPYLMKVSPNSYQRKRHKKKYAEGELPKDRSFYFKGANDALNLRAQNLIMFLQIAEGVDGDTWLHHLKKNDYSKWIRQSIKDEELAATVEEIENSTHDRQDSFEAVKKAIESEYTLSVKSLATQEEGDG